MSWLAEELIVPAFMFSREAFGRGDYGGKWFWKAFETNMWEYDELFVSHHEEFLHEKIPEYTERHQVLGKTQGYQTPKTDPHQEGPDLEGQGT